MTLVPYNEVEIKMETLPKEGNRVEKPEESPGVVDVFAAGFRQENTIVNLFTSLTRDREVSDPSYNPFENVQGYEQFIDRFAYADNDEDVNEIKKKIDKEQSDRRILQDAGVLGFAASATAAIVDPTILLPAGMVLKGGSLVAKTSSAIASTAAAGAGAVAAQESVLLASQETRTADESVNNIVAGAVFGGIFGGVFGGAAAAGMARASVKAARSGEEIAVDLSSGVPKMDDAGAARVRKDIGDEGIAGINDTLARAMSANASPVVRGLTSKLEIMREYTNGIFEHNFILGKNSKGVASDISIETKMKLDAAEINKTTQQVAEIYKSYKKSGNAVLNAAEFNKRVGMAMRRGDVDDIAEVAEAARIYRKAIDDSVVKMQKLGILGDDLEVSTAASYFTRRYNLDKIRAAGGQEKLSKIIVRNLEKKGLDPEDALSKADQIITNILGEGDAALGIRSLTKTVSSGGKFTKSRVLDIPDEELEEFLISDATEMVNSYLSQASGMVRLQEFLQSKFPEKGADVSVNDLRSAIVNEADNMRVKDPSNAELYAKAKADALKDIDNFISAVLGTILNKSALDPALRVARKWQVMSKLGGVTLSSLPDLAMPIFKFGIGDTLRSGYLPMIKSLKTAKLTKDELKDFGIGIEIETNHMLRAITENDYLANSNRGKVERGADYALDAFSKLSGMAYWNNFNKRLAAQVSQAKTIRTLLNYNKTGKISKADEVRLLSLGLSKNSWSSIIKQFEKHGSKESGSYIANFKNWDKDTKELFGAALRKDVDSTIIVPGKGDIPIWVQRSEMAKVFTQFKSFILAATTKILMSGLQRHDKNVLQGVVALIALGYMSKILKDQINGKDTNDDIETVIMEGIARSGLSGIIGEVPLAIAGSSRFSQQTAYGMMFGPAVQNSVELYQSLDRALEGKWSRKDTGVVARSIPFNNLFYLKYLMNEAKK